MRVAQGVPEACMLALPEVEVELVVSRRERSVELAVLVAEEAVQAPEQCRMLAQDKVHTSKRRHTSTSDVVATLMQFAPGGISLASSRPAAF